MLLPTGSRPAAATRLRALRNSCLHTPPGPHPSAPHPTPPHPAPPRPVAAPSMAPWRAASSFPSPSRSARCGPAPCSDRLRPHFGFLPGAWCALRQPCVVVQAAALHASGCAPLPCLPHCILASSPPLRHRPRRPPPPPQVGLWHQLLGSAPLDAHGGAISDDHGASLNLAVEAAAIAKAAQEAPTIGKRASNVGFALAIGQLLHAAATGEQLGAARAAAEAAAAEAAAAGSPAGASPPPEQQQEGQEGQEGQQQGASPPGSTAADDDNPLKEKPMPPGFSLRRISSSHTIPRAASAAVSGEPRGAGAGRWRAGGCWAGGAGSRCRSWGCLCCVLPVALLRSRRAPSCLLKTRNPHSSVSADMPDDRESWTEQLQVQLSTEGAKHAKLCGAAPACASPLGLRLQRGGAKQGRPPAVLGPRFPGLAHRPHTCSAAANRRCPGAEPSAPTAAAPAARPQAATQAAHVPSRPADAWVDFSAGPECLLRKLLAEHEVGGAAAMGLGGRRPLCERSSMPLPAVRGACCLSGSAGCPAGLAPSPVAVLHVLPLARASRCAPAACG